MISPRRLAELLELPVPAATAPFSAVVIDSREAQPGSLFVALRGERTDGHRYVDDAVSRGATGLLVSQPVDVAAGVDLFSVDDTLAALQRAAAAWRNQIAATVVGITGSVGKTTVREATSQLLGQVLGAQRRTYQSPRNFNGDIGLPIALLGLGPEHEWAVLELGPYSQAEMELLVCTARADVGIVTNVGPTHLERFGTLDDTERIKGLLPASLPSDGLAILNADDPRVLNMARRTSAEVLTFGGSADADLRASDVEALGFGGLRFALHHRGSSTIVHTPSGWRAPGDDRARGGGGRAAGGAVARPGRGWSVVADAGVATGSPLRAEWGHGDRRRLQRRAALDARGARPVGAASRRAASPCSATCWSSAARRPTRISRLARTRRRAATGC